MTKRLWTVAVVVACALVLSGCISFPPHYDANPHVGVEYKCVTFLPGSDKALFIKKVTQVITKPRKEYYWPFPAMCNWTFHEEAVWTKLFICSANIETEEKKALREWPHDLGEPTAWYLVSRPLHLAGFLAGPYWQQKIVVMNLDTFDWSYIKHPNAPYSSPSPASVALSPDEKEFAVLIRTVYAPNGSTPHVQGVAVCRFEGGMRFVPTDEPPAIVEWLQKSNRIRAMMNLTEFVMVDPVSLSVEKVKLDRYRDIPPDEAKPPLNLRYQSRAINLGTPGSFKGRLSSSKAATLW